MENIKKLNKLLSLYKLQLEEERAGMTSDDVPEGRLNQVITIETISFLCNITNVFLREQLF